MQRGVTHGVDRALISAWVLGSTGELLAAPAPRARRVGERSPGVPAQLRALIRDAIANFIAKPRSFSA
jgi:hypothetical protein